MTCQQRAALSASLVCTLLILLPATSLGGTDASESAFTALLSTYAEQYGAWARLHPDEASRISEGAREHGRAVGTPRLDSDAAGEPNLVAFDGAPLRISAEDADPVTRARRALDQVGGLWIGRQRPPLGLVHKRTGRNWSGLTYVTFYQEVDGVPLLGAELTVFLTSSGDLRRVSGTYRSDTTVVTRGDFLLGTEEIQIALEEWFGSSVWVHDLQLYVRTHDKDPRIGWYSYFTQFNVDGEEMLALVAAETGYVETTWKRYSSAKLIIMGAFLE